MMMRRMAGMMAGGLFNVRLTGSGIVAITSHYEPLTLRVSRQSGPVFTDPNATVAWSGGLTPEFATDISIGTFFGRGSGESIQMKFHGEGWVVFANPGHAFPQRIEYRRDGTGLQASISGPGPDGKRLEIPFAYRRCGS